MPNKLHLGSSNPVSTSFIFWFVEMSAFVENNRHLWKVLILPFSLEETGA